MLVLMVFAGIMGFGNSISSGLNITLGADLAPKEVPARDYPTV